MSQTDTLENNYKGTFDGKIGFGKRPAILSIDFVNSYTTEGSALYAKGVVEAVRQSVPLYATARRYGVPIIYTRVIYRPDGKDGGTFVQKIPTLLSMTKDNPLTNIVVELEPQQDDVVLVKKYPSAFFGTTLTSILHSLEIDTLILTGCSTSGCVRATAVDAVSSGFRVIVPEECVGDRHDGPHVANLFDINAKYGDVVSREAVVTYFKEISASGS